MSDSTDDFHAETNGPFSTPSAESISPRMGSGRNRVLDGLDAGAWKLIEPHLRHVTLVQGEVLEREGQASIGLYFPVMGAVSLEADGDRGPLQLALIGADGLVGASLLLGGVAASMARVQFPGAAWCVPAPALEACLRRSHDLHRQLLVAVADLLARVSRTAWANGRALVEHRLAAWVSTAARCLDQDEIAVTHQTLSDALGVRRATATVAMHALEKTGAVRSDRGRIRIFHPQRLAVMAGDCLPRPLLES
jgi:CRP-like cAMP-binding protein